MPGDSERAGSYTPCGEPTNAPVKSDPATDPGARFRTDGYVRLDGLFSGAEIASLKDEIDRAARLARGGSSLDRGGLTFEENVFLRSAPVRDFVSQQRLIEVLVQIVGPGFLVRWDQCVRKRSGAAEFPWHQDNAYSRLRDEHVQVWIALTAGTRANGGLRLAPGGPRRRLPHVRTGNHLRCEVPAGREVLVEAAPGDVVVFSSFVPHSTGPNTTEADRIAYVVEYMSLESYDPLLRPPYYVVAEHGERSVRFAGSYPGRTRGRRLRALPLLAATRARELIGR